MSSLKKIQIHVSVAAKPNPLVVAEDETLDAVCHLISTKFIPKVPPENIKLVHAAQQFEYGLKHSDGTPKNLKHIQAGHLANFAVIMELPGGMFRYLQSTTSEKYPDIVTFDSGPTPRTIMPCGHAIGRESMVHLMNSSLNLGQFEFKCAGCSSKWEWQDVKYVADLTNEAASQAESKLTNNYISKKMGIEIQECPGCGIMTTRSRGTGKLVKCLNCTSANGKPYNFCWECSMPVTGNLVGCVCQANESKKLKMLAECPLKKIEEVTAPSVRACPKCGLLIEHTIKCSHVVCKHCTYQFCFVCLSIWTGSGQHRTQCVLANRQKTIPRPPRV